MNPDPPDYRKILAAQIEQASAHEPEDQKIANWFLFEEGKELELRVKVTDPEVARAVLGDAFGSKALMPGMTIENIRFSDLERKDVVRDWLSEQILKIDHDESP